MGKRAGRWLNVRSATRHRRVVAVSTFSIFLLGFGLIYWMFHFFTIMMMPECEYALVWLNGWTHYQSGFQVIGLSIVLCALVWTLRLMGLRNLNRVETVVQLVFILGLFGAFAAQKAYLFPYATPSRAQVDRVVSILTPSQPRLQEEHDLLQSDIRTNWQFDYPPPPFARKPERPGINQALHVPPEQIFLSEDSPTYADFKRLRVCYENYKSAEIQHQHDIKVWDDYWEGFAEKYPRSARRYQ